MTKKIVLAVEMHMGDDVDGEAISTAFYNWLFRESPKELRQYVVDVRKIIETDKI